MSYWAPNGCLCFLYVKIEARREVRKKPLERRCRKKAQTWGKNVLHMGAQANITATQSVPIECCGMELERKVGVKHGRFCQCYSVADGQPGWVLNKEMGIGRFVCYSFTIV